MSDSPTPQQSSHPAAKPRNPVEKFLVRGLIAVLLVLVGIEGYFRMDYGKALDALKERVKAVDSGTGKAVTETDVKAILGDRKPSRTEEFGASNPSRNGAKRLDVYSWFTLKPDGKREICVYYGAKGTKDDVAEVIAVQTDEKIEDPHPPALGDDQPKALGGAGGMVGPSAGGPGDPGAAGGHGGGGGRRGGGARRGAPAAADGEKSDADKTDTDKPADEKPSDAKTEKSDSDQE